MKYIYITGRGRSGSTVIDAMLGNSKSIESVGELVSGLGRFNAMCSCGKGMNDCGYWTIVRQNYESKTEQSWDKFAKDTVKSGHVKEFMDTLFGNSKFNRELVKDTEQFTQGLLEVAGKKAILDSSKNPNRALWLAKFYDDSKIIHLVKHPDGVAASKYKFIGRGKGYKFLRKTYLNPKLAPLYMTIEAISWMVGNTMIGLIKLIRPKKVMLVKYEDFGAKPEVIFEKLSKFLEIDLSEVRDAVINGHPLTFGHTIGGNGVRNSETFVFSTKKGKKRPMPIFYKFLIRIFCWPLMLIYGYRFI
ncbi:sulfotransferase [Flagellimonas flava]|uniref:sulfotransferase n=1 Tax=Flagellimonas flava TaxID=570519 RepID=UPI003D64B583